MSRAPFVALAAALAAAPAPATEAPAAPTVAAAPAGETVVAARAIRVRTVLTPEDLRVTPGGTPGALSDPFEAVGMAARTTLPQGRAITAADLEPPAFVDRNQPVTMLYQRGGLSISAEGRALGRAAEGEAVRVMNMDSRTIVDGVATAPGVVVVR
jgi:flagella basal body P-ring formation protein FlgA